MPAARGCSPKYDLDLSRIGDEALVVLAKECDYQPAAHALIARFHPWVIRLIACIVGPKGLGAADLEDAEQEAVFWMLEGIARYNTLELARPKGRRFRTYLYMLVRYRFIDFVRPIRRRERHFACRVRFSLRGHFVIGRISSRKYRRPGRDNPASALERKENQMRLQRALDRLDEEARSLWECLASGMRLRDIARRQGISYPQAKRQRRKLLAKLVAHLREKSKGPGQKPAPGEKRSF